MGVRSYILATAISGMSVTGVNAQFMTAAEVKPIVDVISGSWVSVREWEGQDWVYFTILEVYRCGFSGVRYGINSDTADTPYALDECYVGTANPNSVDPVNHPPYVILPLGSVQKITVDVKYDDGSITSHTFERAAIQIP